MFPGDFLKHGSFWYHTEFLSIITLTFIHCGYILQRLRLMEPQEAMKELGMTHHRLRFTSTLLLEDDGPPTMTTDKIYHDLKRYAHYDMLAFIHIK